MSKLFDGKEILVTGGTGSIGRYLVRELLKFDIHKLVIFSRDEIKQFTMRKMIDDQRLRFIVGDIRDYKSLKKVFNGTSFDVIYHTAAMKHVVVCEENPLEAVKTNIIGTYNIVDLAKREGVPKLINISTDKAVNPSNVMGATKFIAERIVLNADYTSIRFGNVAGSRGSVIPVLLEELIRKRQLTITDPNVTRFILRLPDAIKLVLKATEYSKGGEIFVLKMKAFRLSDLVDILINNIARRLGISNKIKVNTVGLLRGEKLNEVLISELELPYLYDLGELYVIKPKAKPLTTPKITSLSSDCAKLVSRDELKKIVEECVNKYLSNYLTFTI